jgi:hypothetical protein
MALKFSDVFVCLFKQLVFCLSKFLRILSVTVPHDDLPRVVLHIVSNSRNQYRGGGGFSPPGFSRAREEMRIRQEERDVRRDTSPDDIERYRFIKEQHEKMEEERRKHALKV